MLNHYSPYLRRRNLGSLLFAAVAFAVVYLAATCFGGNPFITSIYTADPAAHVWSDGRLYVYPSHDTDPPLGSNLMDRHRPVIQNVNVYSLFLQSELFSDFRELSSNRADCPSA